MKLTKGTLKVIVGFREACIENDRRAAVGGKRFVPPYTVYEWNEELRTLDVHRAFSVIGQSVRPKTSLGRFPYSWAPTILKEERLWCETRGELILQTDYNIDPLKETNG